MMILHHQVDLSVVAANNPLKEILSVQLNNHNQT